MTDTTTTATTTATRVNRPVWVDLATSDAAGAREFYAKLFGWNVEVSDDPQYGGYGLAKIDGRDAAGIGPAQSEGQPTVWSLYIGTDDVDALAQKVQSAGGTVVAPPFDVGNQGRMAVFQDPAGAFISAWQAGVTGGLQAQGSNTFSWAELDARGLDRAIEFYRQMFGWTTRQSPTSEGAPPYTEFQVDGESILGAQEMPAEVPAEVPSYWLVYFHVDDVAATAGRAVELGGEQLVPPQEYFGGHFAVVTDPQGAAFGLFKSRADG
ncbi:MAG TPA: VOC family protein [Candidatus Limnocylindria bacterium]|nr:VOC family protein [Candidatus Limnocylindria bacterium]